MMIIHETPSEAAAVVTVMKLHCNTVIDPRQQSGFGVAIQPYARGLAVWAAHEDAREIGCQPVDLVDHDLYYLVTLARGIIRALGRLIDC
jgi:hypothetical protein